MRECDVFQQVMSKTNIIFPHMVSKPHILFPEVDYPKYIFIIL